MKSVKKILSCLLMLSLMAVLLLPLSAWAAKETEPYNFVFDSTGRLMARCVVGHSSDGYLAFASKFSRSGNSGFQAANSDDGPASSMTYVESLEIVEVWKLPNPTADSVTAYPTACPSIGETLSVYYVTSDGTINRETVEVLDACGIFDDGTALVGISKNFRSAYSTGNQSCPIAFFNAAGYLAGVLPGGSFTSREGKVTDGYERVYVPWFDKDVYVNGGSAAPAPTAAPTAAPAPAAAPTTIPAETATPSASSAPTANSNKEKPTDLDSESHKSSGGLSNGAIIAIVAAAVAVVGAVAVAVTNNSNKKPNIPGSVISNPGNTMGIDQLRQNPPTPTPGPAPMDSGFRIEGRTGFLQGRRIMIPMNDALRLGREQEQNNVVFPGDTPGVSRTHCRIWVQNGAVIVEDLGSSRGTYLGGGARLAPNQPVRVNVGEIVWLGSNQQQIQIVQKGG